jgi:TolA-binding protein
MYTSAMRDKSSGNLDLALAQFTDYLKYFGSTESAPNAQYQIGEIYYQKGEFASALPAFDLVLEKYAENSKTRDAVYMKGMTLVKMGRRTDGGSVFRDLIEQYPASEQAAKANVQLKNLGLPAARPRPTKKKAAQ